jgi:hypothetical protein
MCGTMIVVKIVMICANTTRPPNCFWGTDNWCPLYIKKRIFSLYVEGSIGKGGINMVKEHEIYMGNITLETIKNEIGDSEFTWYKANMVELACGTYRETSYYLSSRYLIEAITSAVSLTIRKFDRSKIKRVEKAYNIKQYNIELDKITIYFKDDDSIYFKRPNQCDYKDIREFEKFFKQI